ncbi:Maf family protein [Kiloniella litopenaei]|uniref:Maf family protein n=1 Tax=Kiloniella litopenaei TaxID=1549748 RepID=UPI003BAB78C1
MGDTKTLVLASASPRRKQLLEKMGIAFTLCPADVQENNDTSADPEAIAMENARLKAAAVLAEKPDALVLGSDTVVALEGEVLHKPQDLEDAYRMLTKLSGKRHTVYSGVCLLSNEGVDECHSVGTQVRFKPLTQEQIKRYCTLVDPLDRAGAYSIEDHSELILDQYEGSYTNIVGLPTELLAELLAPLGFLETA